MSDAALNVPPSARAAAQPPRETPAVGAEAGVPMPRVAAEWMGLAAGVAWAASMVS